MHERYSSTCTTRASHGFDDLECLLTAVWSGQCKIWGCTWVALKIMAPFWVLSILRHLVTTRKGDHNFDNHPHRFLHKSQIAPESLQWPRAWHFWKIGACRCRSITTHNGNSGPFMPKRAEPQNRHKPRPCHKPRPRHQRCTAALSVSSFCRADFRNQWSVR